MPGNSTAAAPQHVSQIVLTSARGSIPLRVPGYSSDHEVGQYARRSFAGR